MTLPDSHAHQPWCCSLTKSPFAYCCCGAKQEPVDAATEKP